MLNLWYPNSQHDILHAVVFVAWPNEPGASLAEFQNYLTCRLSIQCVFVGITYEWFRLSFLFSNKYDYFEIHTTYKCESE
jgi:hypothetical protein